MTRPRPLLLGLAVAVAGLTVASSPGAAFAQASGSAPPPPDYSVGDEIERPGRDPGGGPQPVGHTGLGGPSQCVWRPVDEVQFPRSDGPAAFPDIGPPPTEDAHLIFERCGNEWTGNVQWAVPDAPAPRAAPPPPEQLAEMIRVRLEGVLPTPVVSTDPPSGTPAVINHPTFVQVENWTGTVTDQECVFFLCVTVTATPSLTWTPGEPGAPSIACAGRGTRFDPAGPLPQTQAAAAGACAHVYQARTGAEGRPEAWPGTVTVTWDLTWSSTTGIGGTLEPVTKSADLPRAVNEVQTVVVSG